MESGVGWLANKAHGAPRWCNLPTSCRITACLCLTVITPSSLALYPLGIVPPLPSPVTCLLSGTVLMGQIQPLSPLARQ